MIREGRFDDVLILHDQYRPWQPAAAGPAAPAAGPAAPAGPAAAAAPAAPAPAGPGPGPAPLPPAGGSKILKGGAITNDNVQEELKRYIQSLDLPIKEIFNRVYFGTELLLPYDLEHLCRLYKTEKYYYFINVLNIDGYTKRMPKINIEHINDLSHFITENISLKLQLPDGFVYDTTIAQLNSIDNLNTWSCNIFNKLRIYNDYKNCKTIPQLTNARKYKIYNKMLNNPQAKNFIKNLNNGTPLMVFDKTTVCNNSSSIYQFLVLILVYGLYNSDIDIPP